MVQPCWQPLWQFLKKVSMRLSYQLAISLLGNYSRAMVYKHLVHDCGGFTGVYICQTHQMFLLNVCSIWCVKDASDKTLKIKEIIKS